MAFFILKGGSAMVSGPGLQATWDQGHAAAIEALRTAQAPTEYVLIIRRAPGVVETIHCVNADDSADIRDTLAELYQLIRNQVDDVRRGEHPR